MNNGALTLGTPQIFHKGLVYAMSSRFGQSIPIKSSARVSALKIFLKLCLSLIKDEDALEELTALLEEPKEDIR